MTVVLNNRHDITLEAVRRVAWGGEDCTLSDIALAAITRARQSFMKLVNSDRSQFIYGTTTAGGEGARHRLSAEEQKALPQRRQPLKGFSFGDPLPARVTRAIVLARLANFIEGNGKVRPELASRVLNLLREASLPEVPSRGTTWAGETTVPSRLFRPVRESGDLQEGEGMALVNGSCVAPGLAADAALRSAKRMAIVANVYALSIEALNAPLDHYEPVLKDLWGDPHDGMALDALNHLLAGADREGRRTYQAPVSWRIVPRVMGQMYRAAEKLETAASTSLRAVSDNPVYVLPDTAHPLGRAFSTGGYHNGMVTPALDWMAQAWADLCGLADRHTTKLLRGDVSLMPNRLTDADHPFTVRFDVAQVQWGEEARHAAQPTFIPMSEGGGSTQDDTPNPVMIAWRKEQMAAECLDAAMAMLAATASQALHVAGRDPAPPLRPFLAAVRGHFPPVEDYRDQGPEAERLTRAFVAATVSPDPDLLVGDPNDAVLSHIVH